MTDPGPTPDAGETVTQATGLVATQVHPTLADTLNEPVPPAEVIVMLEPETVGTQLDAACVMVSAWPATLSTTLRVEDDEFAATV